LSVCGARFRKGLVEGLNDLFGGLRAHIEEGDAGLWKFRVGLLEKAAHNTGIAGDDAQSAGLGALAQFGQARVAVGGELAEIGDRLEAFAGGGELLEHVVFDAVGHDLSIGAAAVENLGVFGHGQ